LAELCILSERNIAQDKIDWLLICEVYVNGVEKHEFKKNAKYSRLKF